jgi:hypothetical protein
MAPVVGADSRSVWSRRLRVVKPMTYMTVGRYVTPAGAWIPSVPS